MSQPPPMPQPFRRVEKLSPARFVATAALWAILVPVAIAAGLFSGGASVGPAWQVLVRLGGIALAGLIVYAFVRAVLDPRRRAAALVGVAMGIGLCLLLVGACFVIVVQAMNAQQQRDHPQTTQPGAVGR